MATTPPTSLKTKSDRVVSLYSFSQLIPALLEGKKITRVEWEDSRTYYLIHGGLISIHKAGEDADLFRPVILNDGDLGGNDWMVLED